MNEGSMPGRQLSLVVNYDAVDAVIARLQWRGAVVREAHSVRVGKLGRLFYSVEGNQSIVDSVFSAQLQKERGENK